MSEEAIHEVGELDSLLKVVQSKSSGQSDMLQAKGLGDFRPTMASRYMALGLLVVDSPAGKPDALGQIPA